MHTSLAAITKTRAQDKNTLCDSWIQFLRLFPHKPPLHLRHFVLFIGLAHFFFSSRRRHTRFWDKFWVCVKTEWVRSPHGRNTLRFPQSSFYIIQYCKACSQPWGARCSSQLHCWLTGSFTPFTVLVSCFLSIATAWARALSTLLLECLQHNSALSA